MQGYLSDFMMSLFFIFIYTYIYTTSNQHFKAFPVSKINSETSFLYQLLNDNINFIVFKPCKVIYFSFFIIFIIIYIYSYIQSFIYTPLYEHFKAFPVSNINSKTSFVYQLFKENSNFIVFTPCKVIYLSIFLLISLLFIFIHMFI